MRFSHHAERWLPYPVQRIFDFFANPANLPLLMPTWQAARIDAASIIAPPTPEHSRPPVLPEANSTAAGLGSVLTLSFLPFPHAPFRVRWEAEITEFVWDEHFCDRQRKGPFAYWNHCHYFRRLNQQGVEGTVIADDLEYELPLGLAGQFAHRIFLRRQIERTFAFRQDQLARILPGAKTQFQPYQGV
jgi:ligand-binding SRPBCC domain-containing protein